MSANADFLLKKHLSPTQKLLFMPPYHSDELNAIEEVWGGCKMKVAVRNKASFSSEEVGNLVNAALDELNVKNEDGECVWTRCCAHVDAKIKDYRDELKKNLWEEGFVGVGGDEMEVDLL
jgi:hypothetical protein